jgi:uncharacterized integral membrane protein
VVVFLVLLFALGVLVFSIQNVNPVDIVFMGWRFHTFVSHVALIATGVGAAFVLLLLLSRTVRGNIKVWEVQGRLRRLQGELKAAQENQRKLQEELAQCKETGTGKVEKTAGGTVAR